MPVGVTPSPPVVDVVACHEIGGTIRGRSTDGGHRQVANIKQQKKRILISERQRARNLRYRSTIKTLTRRLIEASETARPTCRPRA